MMSRCSLLLCLFLSAVAINVKAVPETIYLEDFDGAGVLGYEASQDCKGYRYWFTKTDGTNLNNGSDVYSVTGASGNFWSAVATNTTPCNETSSTLTIKNIDVSRYNDLSVSIKLAEDDIDQGSAESWSSSNEFFVEFSIDGGQTYSPLICIEGDGTSESFPPKWDRNCDGDADNSEVTSVFAEYNSTGATISDGIPDSASLINIRVRTNNLLGTEQDISFDDITLVGEPDPNVSTDTIPPVLNSHTPLNGDSNVSLSPTIQLAFNELVTATANAVNLSCNGVNQTISGLPVNTATQTLSLSASSLPANTLCTLTVTQGQVVDTSNNATTTSYSFTFTTQAAATSPPFVIEHTPVNNASNVSNTTSVNVKFNESINLDANAIVMQCGGNNVSFTDNSAKSNITEITMILVSPVNYSAQCTVLVLSGKVRDLDGTEMDEDKTFQFVIESAPNPTEPLLISSTPQADDDEVDPRTNVTLSFSEPVSFASGAISIDCDDGSNHPYTGLPSNGLHQQVTLDITGVLPDYELCTVSIDKNKVMDDEGTKMVLDPSFSFDTSEASGSPPEINSVIPQNSSTDVSNNATVIINFDESVNVESSAVVISCDGAAVQFTSNLPLTSQNQITITPATNWTDGAICSVNVLSSKVQDLEGTAMLNDYVFQFSVQSNSSIVLPEVDSIVPANGANSVPVSSSITFSFNKPVSVAAGAVTLNCGSVIAVTDSTTTNSNELTVTPTGTVPNDTECTVLLSASKVTDAQSQNMANDFSSTYRTATATQAGEIIFVDGFEP